MNNISRLVRSVGAGLIVAVSIAWAPQAVALPPGGASNSTPGTDSSVSPSRVEKCGTISFNVSGFPAGEMVYVKIDDGEGQGHDTSVHGSGVVAQQKIGSDGSASGSVRLSCDLPAGDHWLRFLASEQNDKPGGGTLGYSNKSPYFTVVSSDDEESTTTVAAPTSTAKSPANGDTGSKTVRDKSGARERGGSDNGRQADAVQEEVVEEVVVGDEGRGRAHEGAQQRGSHTSKDKKSDTNHDAKSTAANGPLSIGGDKFGAKSSNDSQGAATGESQAVNAASAEARGANVPWIGLFIGGAILIVGMTAINVWLFLQRRQLVVSEDKQYEDE
ncbi:hypothetical protein ACX3U9_10200 [Corynebacterium pyruviciproducens]|uniref:hypothetical protein n=1 Tax=Corynebacterium pyruviciproducens TaxID=598660 RepID=UPI00398377EA